MPHMILTVIMIHYRTKLGGNSLAGGPAKVEGRSLGLFRA